MLLTRKAKTGCGLSDVQTEIKGKIKCLFFFPRGYFVNVLGRLLNFQKEVQVKLIELIRDMKDCSLNTEFTINAHYSTKKQMRFHRHPVFGARMYFKVEDASQKCVHNYMNLLCLTSGGKSRREQW